MVDRPAPRPYRIFPRAEVDLTSAFDYYEAHAPGLGHEFLRAVEATLSWIARYPQAAPAVRGDIRRALLRRFPYGVFFDEQEAELRVLAVVHTHRDPASWPRKPEQPG